MSIEELTKKEQIINFAQSDPFLKISDIAEYVQTTPRYVRTILSEANISLMKLRERYARSMEKRLESQHVDGDLKAYIRLKEQGQKIKLGKINYSLVEDGLKYQQVNQLRSGDRLYKVTQIRSMASSPICLHEVIAYLPEDVDLAGLDNLDELYDKFGELGYGRIRFMKNTFKFKPADKALRQLLKLKEPMVIHNERIIMMNTVPVGLENYYFNYDQIELVLPGELVI
ncbi:MAG: GntR family transcriptional regulator [Halanaerobium sp.]|nr:GntR family transcriptional regulator [Halanaerobium sp.]